MDTIVSVVGVAIPALVAIVGALRWFRRAKVKVNLSIGYSNSASPLTIVPRGCKEIFLEGNLLVAANNYSQDMERITGAHYELYRKRLFVRRRIADLSFSINRRHSSADNILGWELPPMGNLDSRLIHFSDPALIPRQISHGESFELRVTAELGHKSRTIRATTPIAKSC